MTIRAVGVVGGGTMGQGIAITCAAAGLDVLLCEKSAALAARALAEIGEERKYIAGYAGALGGLAFAGGIGENAPAVRERAARGLCAVGVVNDPARNAGTIGREGEITGAEATARVFVVPTNEELLIARDTARIVAGLPAE